MTVLRKFTLTLLTLLGWANAAELSEQQASRQFGYVTMADGVRLAYVVWAPRQPGHYPTVLHYSPYGTSAAPFALAQRFLEAGYAYLGVNMRGTGCSEGVDVEGGGARPATVGRDGAVVVEWAARKTWSSGNIGMIGNSYAGGLQLATAANHPPHLRAIIPSGISASDYRESYKPGGMEHFGVAAWTLSTQASLAQPAEQARIDAGDNECAAIIAHQAPQRAYWDMREHPLHDSWWVERDAESMAGDVTVPTLVMMGWQDEWNLNAGTVLFRQLRAPAKRLILQNGGHGVGAPELRGYGFDHAEAMRWLDRWLKGEHNGVESEPRVTVYWEVTQAPPADGSQARPGWRSVYADWPVPGLHWSTRYLTQDGRLSLEPPADSTDHGERGYLYPTGTELIGDATQFAVPPYPAGSLNYRTEPLAADMTLLGLPLLRFWVSSEQTDTDFMVTLKDIDAGGTTLFLQRGFLRGSMRAVDSARSSPDQIIQSFDHPEPLVPGQITEISLSIPAIGHVVRQGHRLELSILAPSAIPAPVMGGVAVGLPSLNKVYHAPAYPSQLVLPLVPNETALPPPPCGALQFQPCRPAS